MLQIRLLISRRMRLVFFICLGEIYLRPSLNLLEAQRWSRMSIGVIKSRIISIEEMLEGIQRFMFRSMSCNSENIYQMIIQP